MYAESFWAVLLILLDIETLADLLYGVLFGKALQIESLQFQKVLSDGNYLQGLLALLFEFEKKLRCDELGQDVLDERGEGNLEDLHFLHFLLLEIRKHNFVLHINVPVFLAPNDTLLYLVHVNFPFIHLTDL